MALQIWLPLDGDIRNLGVSCANISVMGTGVTFTDGKIGKAATFPNSCASCLYTDGLKLQIFSWAAWIKVFGEGSGSSQRIISEGRDTGSVGTNIYTNKAGTILAWTTHKKNGSISIELNRWYHVTLTADGSNIRFYIDGVLKSTTAYTEDSDYAQSNNAFVLGKMAYSYTSTGSYFPFNGQLNDVRVYDHCLSTAEIKELSQGLILHYKLDESYPMTNKNLLKDFPKYYSKSSYNAYVFYMTEKVVEGQTYTLQFWDVDVSHTGKTESQLGISAFLGGGNWTLKTLNGTDYFTNGHADHIECSFTITSGQASSSDASKLELWIWNSVPQVSGTMSMSIGKWKLEKGDTATPYINCELSDKINPYVVTDSSGYGHVGAIVNEVYYSTDAPRYHNSVNFSTNAAGIEIPSMPTNTFNNGHTFSFWIKPNGENGARSVYFGSWNGNSVNIEKRTDNKLRVYWSGSPDIYSSATVSDGEWQHIAIVKADDKGSISFYKNGLFVDTVTNTFSDKSWSGLFRIGRDTRTSGEMYIGLMSDFRFYCTALSAEDILDLYHTSAKIDKTGKVHTFELVEDTETKVTKTGIVEGTRFFQNGYVFKEGGSIVNFKPGEGVKNSCSSNIKVEFTDVADFSSPIAITIDFDFTWTDFAFQSEPAGSVLLQAQGTNRLRSDSTWKWQGRNCITANVSAVLRNAVNSATSGSQHITVTDTITAEWFETYNASNFSFRCDYSDGNGTLTVTNFKVTLGKDIAKINSQYISANEFIEK